AGMFWWMITGKQKEQQNVASYSFTETDDYIRQYTEWLRLPPDERTELPLVLDKDGKPKTKDQLLQGQQARLKADLDKLATGETSVNPFADILYGESWQEELRKYKERNEMNEYVLTSSIVCTTMGGSIYAWWLLFGTTRFFMRCVSRLRGFKDDNQAGPKKVQSSKSVSVGAKDFERGQKTHKEHSRLEKHLDIIAGSGPKSPVPVKSRPKVVERLPLKGKVSNDTEKITRLLSDEKTLGVKTAAKAVKKDSETREHAKPLNSAINELTEQVSAIREYAANQQDRLEKLQDGYDWNIIRTFCLRVIRCIDNLESRINQMNEKDIKATHLEEVRDELIFALESSGIEQYEPEIHSEYRGQEKYAEAVKDKQDSNNPKQAGKIANIIRPGYQYFINEGNVKVVRPAQVKLFA
ncbi:MAG TPA: nucleotide exchange factor GrpE, partial [Phycisphaerales bacterium]|nr:nucleotide exchange factor GrpE [Phycisphaerales bacterium]